MVVTQAARTREWRVRERDRGTEIQFSPLFLSQQNTTCTLLRAARPTALTFTLPWRVFGVAGDPAAVHVQAREESPGAFVAALKPFSNTSW